MILVTGATGLVGGNLLWFLLQQNEQVVAIRRESSQLDSLRTIFSFYSSTPDIYLKRIIWRTADVLDYPSLISAFENITIVYHCAAVVSLGKKDDLLRETNVTGTKNIVNASLLRNVKKLCFVSSIAACGVNPLSGKIDETGKWNNLLQHSLYAESKFLSETEVSNGNEKGLNTVIVNPGVILGVSGNDMGSSEIFSRVRRGLIFYTAGSSGYVDVQDVAKAMIELTNAEISGENFILVAENISNRKLLDTIAKYYGKRSPFIGINKNILILAGIICELLGLLLKKSIRFDRGTAKSITNQTTYSCEKIKNKIGYEFKPIESCIKEICDFQLKISADSQK